MQDFEKMGMFYLGKAYDATARATRPELLMYASQDLTTHAVCVGMTGSGKTGLCLALLEEAAIDGIPALIIDPKGDLGNLLLAFPDLAPSDFTPWVDTAEAGRRGISPAQLADETATKWREGLAAWGQDPARISRFRAAADVAIYTPGSSAGLSLSVLRSFAAPAPAVLNDADVLRERVGAAVSGLLALLGIDADPLRSREHILLANLVERAWREERDLDLAALIRDIQSPPFDKIGVMDLESIFPAKERFNLSMTLNNLLASPGFSAWMEGEPLDVQRLLYTAEGRPRLAILSIAHLSDAERMFFVTILLNEVVAWMRSQSGTSSLRALLYMDEVFGYFPPTANPPSKTPMLTLLKQARAYGLGVVLATQNPVDLDYKGLANAGTWFIGRMQTERDKARVLDGLEGASAAAGAAFDRQKIDTLISGLEKRVFLMNNVHEDQPIVFQSRWSLSYLCGPLSRQQIQSLMAARKASSKPQTAATDGRTAAKKWESTAIASHPVTAAGAGRRPVLPPEIPELFIPRRQPVPDGSSLWYRPAVVGTARVHFTQAKSNVDVWETVMLLAPVGKELSESIWDDAQVTKDEDREIEFEKSCPAEASNFADVPAELTRPKQFAELTNSLKERLYRTESLELWKCPALKQISQPGESEGDFRVRLSHAARQERDLKVENLRAKYAPKLAQIHERIRRARQKVEKEKSQAGQQVFQAVLSAGSSLLGAFMGRKVASASNLNRAASAVRAAGRVSRERQDVTAATENVDQLQEQLNELDAQFNAEIGSTQDSACSDKLPLEKVVVKPKKSDVGVTLVALVWAPFGVVGDGTGKPLY